MGIEPGRGGLVDMTPDDFKKRTKAFALGSIRLGKALPKSTRR